MERRLLKSGLVLILLIFILLIINKQGKTQIAETQDIDQIINATYDILSGPAAQRDWTLFQSLFHSQGQMGAVIYNNETGNRTFIPFSVEDYIKNNDAFLKKQDFYESEIGRKQLQFGGLTQVLSAYQYKFSTNGKIEARGINSFQLIFEEGRWWIIQLIWEDESNKNPIPQNLLFKD